MERDHGFEPRPEAWKAAVLPLHQSRPQHLRGPTLVEATGFEPATPWSQTKCATKLRYASTLFANIPVCEHSSQSRAGFPHMPPNYSQFACLWQALRSLSSAIIQSLSHPIAVTAITVTAVTGPSVYSEHFRATTKSKNKRTVLCFSVADEDCQHPPPDEIEVLYGLTSTVVEPSSSLD